MGSSEVKTFYLTSAMARLEAVNAISNHEINAAAKVTISNTRSKSARCRGLQWRWYTDVADSGMGSYDTKEDVHRAAKYRWVVPILLRDDDEFCEIWPELKSLFCHDSEKMKYIVDNFVSTEGTDFAIGEYLTNFERYYRGNGVPLTEPERGLLE